MSREKSSNDQCSCYTELSASIVERLNYMEKTKKLMTKTRKAWITSRAMSELGRIGAKARNEKLTPEERKAISVKAAAASARKRRKGDL